MGRIFAVGDIHGNLDPLEDLLAKIPLDWADDYLVFLGDYIDRGPEPRLVLDFLMALKEKHPDRVVCLLGNHEWMFLRYLEGYGKEIYLLNGGEITLAQFLEDGIIHVPTTYISFLRTLLPYWETDRYIFVHAGLRPGIPLKDQTLKELLFIREEFIYSDYDWGKLVIFAHTPFFEPLVSPNKIGIDTGCVYGGALTALELPRVLFHTVSCRR